MATKVTSTKSSTPQASAAQLKAAAAEAAAYKAPVKADTPSATYSIGWKNYTAAQIAGMSDATKAWLASAVKSGKVAVTSGGKTMNLWVTPAIKSQDSVNNANNVTTPVKPVTPVVAAKYDAAAPKTTAQIAADKTKSDNLTAMQKGATKTYQAANGKKYDLETQLDWSVTFNSQDESLNHPIVKKFSNMDEAVAAVQAGNQWKWPTWFMPEQSVVPWLEEKSALTTPENIDLINTQTASELAAKDINDQFTANQEKSQAELNKNIDTYQWVTAEEKAVLAASDAQRQANIQGAQTTMLANAKLADESNQRLIRLQSNEHLDTIMKQYIAKGMTEEEARWQAQNDIEGQLQKERQTILQAEKNNAEMKNQITQWWTGAADTALQWQQANIKQWTANAGTVMNAQNAAEAAAQSAENQSYVNTIQSMGLQNFNTLNDIEKEKQMQVLGINLADKDKRYAAQQFISTMSSFAEKKPTQFAAMLKAINNGTMTLQQAQAWVLGSTSTPAAKTTSTSTTFDPKTAATTADFNF